MTRAGFILAGCGLVGSWWIMRQLGDVRVHLGWFYAVFGVAFGLYLLALALIARWERHERSGARSLPLVIWVAFVAVAARLLLVGTTPTLSDDIYRYQWDGRVQAAGINPYRYPPDSPKLAFLREEQDSRINFPHLRTVYPPLTQASFWVGARLGGTIPAQKAVFIAAELLTVLGLLVLLWRRNRSPVWLAAYAWHPLVILEIAGSGHNDAVGIGFLWIGLAAWEVGRRRAAVLAFSGAFLSKFLSALLVPWWWFRGVARRELWLFAVLSMLPLALFPEAISAITGSLSAMSARVSSNALFVPILSTLTGSAATGKIAAFILLAWFIVWWARRSEDPVRYLGGALGAAALLAPALHPWYLVWLVPCFCFWRMQLCRIHRLPTLASA